MDLSPSSIPLPILYDQRGNNPRAWHAWVETLTESSRKLKDSTPAALPDGQELMLAVNAVYAMVLGYAIECALKGLWVKEGNKLVADGRYVGVPNAGDHELGQLARKISPAASISVSTGEYNLLDRLTAFVVYAGRYPIPLNAEQSKPVTVAGRGKQVSSFFSATDFQTAELLLNRLSRFLNPYLPPAQRLDSAE